MGKAFLLLVFSHFSAALLYSESNLDNFQVLNDQSIEAPPLGHKELSSIGVLVSSANPDKNSFCTATHFVLGKVLTAARCISSSSELSHYNLVFYNREKKRTVIPIEKISFAGTAWIDIAVLTISNVNAKLWEVAGNEIKAYSAQNVMDQYWNDSNEIENVSVWAYIPGDNANVARFQQNKCVASRKLPIVEMKVKEKTSERIVHEWQFTSEDTNPDHVLFLDNCTRPLQQEYSGALITSSKNFTVKIGIVSKYSPDLGKIYTTLSQSPYKEQEISFYYRGTGKVSTKLQNDLSDLTIGLGALLQSVSELKKDIFQKSF